MTSRTTDRSDNSMRARRAASAAAQAREDRRNEIARAADTLRNYGLKPGVELTTVRTGPKSWRVLMIANAATAGEYIADVTMIAARVAGFKLDRDGDNIRGAQSAWWIVYAVGRAMWPEGVERPANVNFGASPRDGGYALRHRSL